MTRSIELACIPFLLLAACYAPHDPISDGDDETGDASTSSGPSTTDPSATTTTSATSASTTEDPSGDPTTQGSTAPDDATDTEAEASSSSSDAEDSTGPLPYCGDGELDEGEDCDNGDANAYENACLPDCTANVCGDAHLLEGTEACDDGDAGNVLEVGACAPDCSRVIEEKIIRLGTMIPDGNFGNNPVAYADSRCPVGYRAMFAYPNVREATTVAFDSVGALDWVLEPYTAYARMDGTLVWITDEIPLLGVRAGAQQSLLASVTPSDCEGLCLIFRAVSGITNDWTTAASQTCSLWSSASAAVVAATGNPYSADEFLDTDETYSCDGSGVLATVYCVED